MALALFGAFGVHIDLQSHGGDCITAAISGVDCPRQVNLFGYLSFHLNALKIFSNATFSPSLLSLLLLLALAATIGASVTASNTRVLNKNLILARVRANPSLRFSAQNNFLAWLATHENSPTLA